MNIEVLKKEISEVYQTPILHQTAFWSEVKSNLGVKSKAFEFKIRNSDLYTNTGGRSYTVSDFLVLIQQLSKESTIAYVPYGPEIEPSEENQGRFLEELSEIVRSYLPSNCIALRYDLNWQSHWGKDDFCDDEGKWMGPPQPNYQEFHFNYNTINWNFKKANTDILPVNTIFIDLQPDVNTILSKMKAKTRYNINLALRKGVVVKEVGMDKLHVWYNLYRDTTYRNNIFLNDIDYFQTVLASKAENTSSPAIVKLLLAELNGEPVSAMFLVITDHRATYLYGASSSAHRNSMSTYALQWEAIRIAKTYGCTEYDMFGIPPNSNPSHPMHGLYQFKIGFGGELYHQMGCWDYPFEKDKYALFQAYEMNSKGYHL